MAIDVAISKKEFCLDVYPTPKCSHYLLNNKMVMVKQR
jgi:hypothetical protein